MKRTIVSLLFLVSVSVYICSPVFGVANSDYTASITPVPTIEYSLPFPGILPDHPLYGLKLMRDKILIMFTRNPVRKTHLNLLLADKKLVMGQLLWEKNDFDLSISTLYEGEKLLLISATGLSDLKTQNNLPEGLADKIELAAKKHQEVIKQLTIVTGNENLKQQLTQISAMTNQTIQQVLSTK
jgi:hypothetical protein